jgi:hypothetical protein
MNRTRLIVPLVAAMVLISSVVSAQTVQLKVDQAALWVSDKEAKSAVAKDAFGPGLDAVHVGNGGGAVFMGGPIKSQLRYNGSALAEGDYYIGVRVLSGTMLGFGEGIAGQLALYHNDTRLAWTSYGEPARTASNGFQAQMRCDRPVHVKCTDVLRLVTSGNEVGDLCLSKTPFKDSVVTFQNFLPQKLESDWLNMGWEENSGTTGVPPVPPKGTEMTQTCWLYNPGVLPRTFTLDVHAVDYLQRVIGPSLPPTQNPTYGGIDIPGGGWRLTITIKPGERITLPFLFKPGDTGCARVDLKASAPDVFPAIFLVKYFVNDVKSGPRPRASLNGAWEQCYVPLPAVEPGDAPPPSAQWTPVQAPELAENKLGHCIWLRRTFNAPDYLKGDRIVFKFSQLISEGWVYVNGKMVHHQYDGTQPFEADVTDAWKPGENQILIACRDWLAYSPKNRQRVQAGEEPIGKDGMIAPSGYIAAGGWGGCMGIGRPLWVEARPAVAVQDVVITTTYRDKKLTLKYTLANKSAAKASVTLMPMILDAGNVIARLEEKDVEINAGATAEVTVTAPWPKNVRLWQPGDPHLYVLKSDLLTGEDQSRRPKPTDVHLQRFGFRDIWIDGISFYINGVRTKIRSCWASGANGGWYGGESDLAKGKELCWLTQMNNMVNGDVQLSRTHNQIGVWEACEVADETGLMLKVENGSFCQEGFTFDKAFWDASIVSETRMVDVYRSHPSVFMWSAGNENMWGWAYQGEATRTMGNRWQVKIVQAMRAHDPQARPVEFEADGDLMGKWEYHQLHYPRELGGSPAVPVSAWWGPLDKKTVIPYSMGDIVLGQKPITDGEAFWPATMNHPFGESILLGDKPYTNFAYCGQGWTEASRYFINGFRDVEFALIDTYNPLALVKPQSIIFKEETRAFFGGQTIARNLNIHNDLPRKSTLRLRWTLSGEGNKGLDHGGKTLGLDPAELARVTIKVDLPKVSVVTPAAFVAELLEDDKVVHTEAREWKIYPAPALAVPPGLKLSLYDPVGNTAKMLQAAKAPFDKMETLAAPAAGALMIGQDALKQPPQGPWREQLLAFVRGGGKIVVMEQSEPVDFLPFPVSLAPKSESTIAFVRAPDHPLLKGLDDDSMKWWAGDHYVSRGNYRKPIGGNFLPLVDVGTMDGLLESPLIEEYLGKGSIVLCQLMVTSKAATAPPAAVLLQNMLDYLAAPAPFRTMGKTAVLAGNNESLRKSLDAAHLVYENLAGRLGDLKSPPFTAAIVDGDALDDATIAALKSFADEGGNVMIYKANPANKKQVEKLLGVELQLFDVSKENTDVRNHVARRTGDGLLGGVSNHDFYWASGGYLEQIHGEGGWWSCVGKFAPEEQIADYFCEPAQRNSADSQGPVTIPPVMVHALTRPGTLVEETCAKDGRILVSQLRFDNPVDACAQTAGRLRSLLLTNLGCTFESQGGTGLSRTDRLRKYQFETIDLGRWANRGMRDDKQAGIVGWSNQGDIDMRNMPTGKQTFADVPFFIAAPKSVCVLQSDGGLNRDLPREIKGIEVGRKADALFFLHSMAYCGADGKKHWKYRVNYKNGTNVEIPIVAGVHVADWWDDPAKMAEAMTAAGVVVGFQCDCTVRKNVIVLEYEWVNPHAEKEIATVDFCRFDENSDGVPILAGITAATLSSDQGVAEDVIGVEGVRVRLGTQLVDVYYIGVKGLAKDAPFYADAVAAHKAMVVGKKVNVLDDVVVKTSAGQRLAYVFLSDPAGLLPGNMLNARVIGDGLGRLGNFEGNNRHRMYLENLGFIAQQGKKGLWGKEK